MTDQVCSFTLSAPLRFFTTSTLAERLLLFLLLLFLVYQEKKPYIDKAAELKALAENGEGSDVSPSCLLVHNIQQLK